MTPAIVFQDAVWGIAYEIKEENVDDVISFLDHREKDGYKKMTMPFYANVDQKPFQINVYVATTDNRNYAGEDSLENIAEQIVRSVGPSGPNVEYVCNLANAMREICPEAVDEHLRDVEAKVLELLK